VDIAGDEGKWCAAEHLKWCAAERLKWLAPTEYVLPVSPGP
jgi:hypothetical protein